MFYVDVFISHIYAAGEGDFTVNDHDLAVVTVVDDDVEDRVNAVERNAFDPFFLKLSGILAGKGKE